MKHISNKKKAGIAIVVLLCMAVAVAIAIYMTQVPPDSTALSGTISLNRASRVFDVAVNPHAEQIGYADQGHITILSSSGEQVGTLSHGEPAYERIAFDPRAEKWWGYNSVDNSFHAFSKDFAFVESMQLETPDLRTIDLFKAHNNRYILLAGVNAQNNEAIWIYDIANSNYSSYEPDGLALSLSFVDEDTLASLISSSSGVHIELYNVSAQAVEGTIDVSTNFAIALGVGPDGKIYYASNRGIYQANEDDHKNVGYIDSIPENAYNETMLKIFPLSDACYVWVNGNEYIECIEYAQKNKTNSVLVVDAPFYIPAAMSIYEESGNRIDFRDQGIVSSEQYLTMMLSEDASVDVYSLKSYFGAEASSIIEKGFYVDLMQSPIIAKDAGTWFESIREDSTHNGEMFGYPYGVSFQMLEYQPDTLKEYGIELTNQEITWNELLDLLEPFRGQKPFPLIVNPTDLMQLLLWQAYSAGEQNFEIALEEALQVLARCKDLGMCDLSPAEYAQTYQFSDEFGMRIELNTVGGDMERPFIAVPSLENSQCGTPVWYDWLLINPYSGQKDKAMEFLEAHAIAHKNGAMEWTAVLAPIPEQYPHLSEEWLAHYEQLISHSTAYIAYPLEYDYFRICEQYLAGQITMEDALGEMVQKYHLAENE